MKRSTLGAVAAAAVASLVGTATIVRADTHTTAKACYRSHCGKSVKGYEGQCGGTKVDGVSDQKACEEAGGAWTTEVDAAKFKKPS